ncbi:MAG: hypothetical protein ACLU38_14930 [Dysosmobacter sp.]
MRTRIRRCWRFIGDNPPACGGVRQPDLPTVGDPVHAIGNPRRRVAGDFIERHVLPHQSVRWRCRSHWRTDDPQNNAALNNFGNSGGPSSSTASGRSSASTPRRNEQLQAFSEGGGNSGGTGLRPAHQLRVLQGQ